MNETLEPYVKKLLDGGMKTAEEVATFIETQTPQLAHEVIVWGAVSEIMMPLAGLLILISAFVFHKKFKKKEWYTKDDWHPPSWVVTTFGTIIGAGMFLFNVLDIVYPLVAPRLFILEKISFLIK